MVNAGKSDLKAESDGLLVIHKSKLKNLLLPNFHTLKVFSNKKDFVSNDL